MRREEVLGWSVVGDVGDRLCDGDRLRWWRNDRGWAMKRWLRKKVRGEGTKEREGLQQNI